MKGVISVIEALVGAFVILGVMFFLFAPSSMIPKTTDGMYDITYNCLIYSKDSPDMDASLRECIPSSYDFQVKICNSADCTASVPSGAATYSAEYIEPNKLIKLWVY